MKKNLQPTKEFDRFIKEKYTNDIKKPSPELWEKINQNLKFSSIAHNYRNILRLKIAMLAIVIALIGTITYFEIEIHNTKLKSAKHETDLWNNIINPHTNFSNSLDNRNRNILKNSGTNNADKHLETKHSKSAQANSTNHIYPKTIFTDNNLIDTNINSKISYMHAVQVSSLNIAYRKDILSDAKFTDPNNYTDETEAFSIDNENTGTIDKTIVSNDKQEQDMMMDNPSKINSETKNTKDKFSLELFFSPEFSYRFLFNNPDYYNPDLSKTYFNSRENPNLSFSGGLLFVYQVNEKWRITGGLAYSQYSQKMKANSFDLKINNQNGYYIYTSIGLSDVTISSSVPVNKSDFLKSTAVYSFIDIPVGAEYQLSKHFFINGGINYSFMFDKNINWQAEDYNGDFNVQTNDIVGLKISNLSFVVGAGFEQKFRNKFRLILNPSFKMFVTSLTHELPVKTHPYSIGLKIGLRYKL